MWIDVRFSLPLLSPVCLFYSVTFALVVKLAMLGSAEIGLAYLDVYSINFMIENL
jgi:hypothetical protein